MSTQPAVRRWTYEEFSRLPNDGNRYEIIGGELVVTPAPRPLHAKVATRISRVLEAFVEANGLGEVFGQAVDVLFGEGGIEEAPDLVVEAEAPDLVVGGVLEAFVEANGLGEVFGQAVDVLFGEGGIEEAPDLVVEVLSPTTMMRDRGIKRERYAHFGVAEYWIVDPAAKRIEFYRSIDGWERPAVIATDSFEWEPVSGGPKLTLNVVDLLRDLR